MKVVGIEIYRWLRCAQQLLERARDMVANAQYEAVRSMTNRLPRQMAPDCGQRLSVVFAGQYSAGKSTILRAMTGRDDIDVSAEITTQSTREYDWNGIVVIDTPGVHTTLRPDHDEMTYEAISTADLLVFVITNELFDSHLGEHFRKIAIVQEKAHEMMLVVNKMQRSAEGNTPQVHEVIRNDLRKVLAPFTPEEFRMSFIDAALAVEARQETDRNLRHLMERKSSFGTFLECVNKFVRDKGLIGRYTTTLYTLEQVIQEALAAVPTDEPDVGALEELRVQERRALLDTRQHVEHAIATQVRETSSAIRNDGREVAGLIDGNVDQGYINHELKEIGCRINQRSEQLAKKILAILEQHQEKLDERIHLISESEIAKGLLSRLQRQFETSGPGTSAASNAQYRHASEVMRQLGAFLTKHSFNVTAGTSGLLSLGQHSDTAVHRIVKAAGHSFGKSFKPWEAVKWTRVISNAGRVLSVAGVVLSFALQLKEDSDAAKRESDLRDARDAIRTGINEAAHAVETYFDQQMSTYIAVNFDRDIGTLDDQIKEIRYIRTSKGVLSDGLMTLLEETRMLVSEMHQISPAMRPNQMLEPDPSSSGSFVTDEKIDP